MAKRRIMRKIRDFGVIWISAARLTWAYILAWIISTMTAFGIFVIAFPAIPPLVILFSMGSFFAGLVYLLHKTGILTMLRNAEYGVANVELSMHQIWISALAIEKAHRLTEEQLDQALNEEWKWMVEQWGVKVVIPSMDINLNGIKIPDEEEEEEEE